MILTYNLSFYNKLLLFFIILLLLLKYPFNFNKNKRGWDKSISAKEKPELSCEILI